MVYKLLITFYYFGSLQRDQSRVDNLMRKFGPSLEKVK
jgi:hypothetical protein